jgi:phosphoenolpyruvate carboxykinase (GTP)
VNAIDTPIGYLPEYGDLKALFKEIINKDYSQALYDKQFSLYVDNITSRIDLQLEAYGKEENLPARLFEVLKEQRQGLMALKERYGAIVSPAQLADSAVGN